MPSPRLLREDLRIAGAEDGQASAARADSAKSSAGLGKGVLAMTVANRSDKAASPAARATK